LLLARFVAVEGSRWVVRDVARRDTELLFWMLPRGLVTAVLALEIVNDRGAVFAFLPAMAFTVVMVTNLFIVWGSVRAARHAAAQRVTATPVLLEEPTAIPVELGVEKAIPVGPEDSKAAPIAENAAQAAGSGSGEA
jgi:hypothetical protein